jgi:hypothetical protein
LPPLHQMQGQQQKYTSNNSSTSRSNKWKKVQFVAGHESGKGVTLGGTATVKDDNYLKGDF